MTSDAALAADLAHRAGVLLREVRASGGHVGEALGKAGDAAANRLLVDALTAERPGDGLLSEERLCDGTRLTKSRVWIVDPVDGTREYGEGRDDWAVHVALVVDNVAVAGAVALPDAGLVMRSDRPMPLVPPHAPLRLVVSRTRPPAQAQVLADRLGATLVPMGSAGAKAMAVVLGEADVYLHAGGQFEWDSAAPVAVAEAFGFHCSRLDGTPLRYNSVDPYIADLLICAPALRPAVLAALA